MRLFRCFTFLISIFLWVQCTESAHEHLPTENNDSANPIPKKSRHAYEHYIDEKTQQIIRQKKSVYACLDHFSEPIFTELIFRKDTLEAYWMNHEVIVGRYTENDSAIILHVPNYKNFTFKKIKNGFLYQKQKLVALQNKQPQGFLQRSLSGILFSGLYKKSNGDTIRLSEQGKIHGLNPYTSFYVWSDFDNIADFDLLYLSKDNGKKTWYGWSIYKDTLAFYTLNKGEEYQYRKGKKSFYLVKI